MKVLLKASLLLNAVLVLWLIVLISHRPERGIGVAPVTESGAQVLNPIESPTPATQQRPFEWSRIESTDYRIYVANLRAIGCPERTIRDIIAADLDTLYAPKREALRGKSNGTAPFQAGLALRHELESGLEALNNEESAILAALLGGFNPAPAASLATGNASPSPNPHQHKSAPAIVALPLVFQPIDPNGLNLNDRQRQAIGDLQQLFVEQLGGPDQDPNDPAYRERWLKAQPEIDNLLRGMIGSSAFQNYQLAARASQQPAANGN